MKVLEVKNNLVKIAYDSKDNLVLSGFVIIEDETTPYVAQVVNLRADTTSNYAIVKLLFTFNEEGILKNYNGSIPSTKAEVSKLPSSELLDILPIEKPVKLGNLAQQNFELKIDESVFRKNLLICSNNQQNTDLLLDNFVRQLEKEQKKIVIFDINGEFDWDKKIVFGEDFKLPLNYETINYIYNNDLEDVDATSKAIIQDIFIELQEYTKTLPEEFIPFDSFFTVVDQQYKETGMTQLVLLKNKLLKYRDAEVFAQNLKDVLNLSIAIEKSNMLVLDISVLSPKLQNEVMSYAYTVMSKINVPIYSFIKAENRNITKKLLKRIINEKNNINSTVICAHEFKYIKELKQAAENMIFFAPLTLEHDFGPYNTFLNKLNSDEFVVYGNLTQHIPLIVQLEKLNLDNTLNTEDQDDINTDNNDSLIDQVQEEQDELVEEQEPITTQEDDANIQAETSSNEQEEQLGELSVQDETPIEEVSEVINDNLDIDNEEAPAITNIQENEIIEQESNPEIITPEFIEEPIEEVNNEEVVITPIEDNISIESDDIIEEPLIEEEIDFETTPIIEEKIVENEPIIEEIEEPSTDEIISFDVEDELQLDSEIHNEISIEDEPISVDLTEMAETVNEELTEDDLNFIDELSTQEQILDENISTEDILQAVDQVSEEFETQNNQTTQQQTQQSLPEPEFIEEQEQVPVVPVYPADEYENDEVPVFEAGDEVTHPKYGRGVVEKMIKYGNKTLYSVSFNASGIGRRLLDPVITELKRI